MTIKYLLIGLLAIINIFSTLFLRGDILLPNIFNLILIVSLFLLKCDFKEKPIGLLISFLYFQMSLVWAPFLWYFLSNQIELGSTFRLSFIIGICFQLFILTLLQFSESKLRNRSFLPSSPSNTFQLSPLSLLLFFFPAVFITSWISHFLGVSAMGIEKHLTLPYKLEPLLNILRGNVFPMISILVFLKLEKQKQYQYFFLALYTIWAIFEVWAKGSKAFLVIAYFPYLLLVLHKFFFSFKKIIGFSFIVFFIFVGNYVIGDYLRENKMNLKSHNIQREHYLDFVLEEAFFRLFPDAVLIERFKEFKPTGINWILFTKERGAPNIHTYLIDGFPRNAAHSSGITALTDGYLFAGQWGLIIAGISLLFIFLFFDFFFAQIPSLKVLGITYFFHCLILGEGFISYLFFRNPMTSLASPFAIVLTYLAMQKTSLKSPLK